MSQRMDWSFVRPGGSRFKTRLGGYGVGFGTHLRVTEVSRSKRTETEKDRDRDRYTETEELELDTETVDVFGTWGFDSGGPYSLTSPTSQTQEVDQVFRGRTTTTTPLVFFRSTVKVQ